MRQVEEAHPTAPRALGRSERARDAAARAAAWTWQLALRIHLGTRKPENWAQLFKFGVIGASGYVINLAVFAALNEYQSTMHFNGQSTIELDGDRATGESYCIAHHLFTKDGERKLMVAWIRYGDTFVKQGGSWLFTERQLYVDWTETRASRPG